MLRVLLIGVGYFPYPTAGEKNYFYRLCSLLDDRVKITIFSLNDSDADMLTQDVPGGNISVYCARRPFHNNYDQYYFSAKNYVSYHHRHKPQQEIAEKFISIIAHLPRLREIIHKHDIQVIHFMDNFGPGMPFLKLVFPRVKITYSAANYDPRQNRSLYDRYLLLSVGYLDGAGVYTEAYRKILEAIGIKIPLKITRWGVNIKNIHHLDQSMKDGIRQSLGIRNSGKLLLWSGYLQQIQAEDFNQTIDIARQVSENNKDVTFLFAFKPETFQQSFADKQAERVIVLSGLENFGEVLETADMFLSPIGRKESTVSPPLTWLEAMSKGTPVITTNIRGVDEVIEHNINGFIAQDYHSLADVINDAVHRPDLDRISDQAIVKVREMYDIQKCAQDLINFWKEICK